MRRHRHKHWAQFGRELAALAKHHVIKLPAETGPIGPLCLGAAPFACSPAHRHSSGSRPLAHATHLPLMTLRLLQWATQHHSTALTAPVPCQLDPAGCIRAVLTVRLLLKHSACGFSLLTRSGAGAWSRPCMGHAVSLCSALHRTSAGDMQLFWQARFAEDTKQPKGSSC